VRDAEAEMKDKTIEIAVLKAEKKHGSLRAAGDALEIDPAYLLRLKTGAKDNPGDEVLRKLGLKRTVKYEPI
jgi:hypothetical protein